MFVLLVPEDVPVDVLLLVEEGVVFDPPPLGVVDVDPPEVPVEVLVLPELLFDPVVEPELFPVPVDELVVVPVEVEVFVIGGGVTTTAGPLTAHAYKFQSELKISSP